MVATPDEIRARLREWPRSVATEPQAFARTALEACCAILRSRAAVLAWDDPEEPWVVVTALRDGEFTWREDNESLDVISGRFREEGNLVISIEGDSVRGSLFVPEASVDESTRVLAEVVGLLIARDMDFIVSMRAACRDAVRDERMRVARDLHDGLLQSFTGVVLQLETLHNMIEKQPADARRLITNVQGVIMADQRDLRSYVEQLRPRRRIDEPFDFLARLNELRSRFKNQWGIGVAVEDDAVDPLVARSLGPETFRIIHEAVTNSGKHGSASNVRIRLSTADSRIWIEVSDDGVGFPFHGRRTLQEVRESGVGPAVLAERVAALNGDLVLESTGTGATVKISIPLGISGA